MSHHEAPVSCMQGSSIEATLWGDFADRCHDMLEEGKVRPHRLPAVTTGFFLLQMQADSQANLIGFNFSMYFPDWQSQSCPSGNHAACVSSLTSFV